MLNRWPLGMAGNNQDTTSSEVCPVVFSIYCCEIHQMLDWMRTHTCEYTEGNKAKELLRTYTNDEIINNGLVSAAFEQYGGDGTHPESIITITLTPSVSGTWYKLNCKCGECFKPVFNLNIHNI